MVTVEAPSTEKLPADPRLGAARRLNADKNSDKAQIIRQFMFPPAANCLTAVPDGSNCTSTVFAGARIVALNGSRAANAYCAGSTILRSLNYPAWTVKEASCGVSRADTKPEVPKVKPINDAFFCLAFLPSQCVRAARLLDSLTRRRCLTWLSDRLKSFYNRLPIKNVSVHTWGMARPALRIEVTAKDQKKLRKLLSGGVQQVRVVLRAVALLQLAQGVSSPQIAAVVPLTPQAIRKVGHRYRERGLERALYEKQRPGAAAVLEDGQRQRIIAMVCSDPPEGRARWTVRLVAEEAVKRRLAPRVGRETIRVLLLHHDLEPWREKDVVRGRRR